MKRRIAFIMVQLMLLNLILSPLQVFAATCSITATYSDGAVTADGTGFDADTDYTVRVVYDNDTDKRVVAMLNTTVGGNGVLSICITTGDIIDGNPGALIYYRVKVNKQDGSMVASCPITLKEANEAIAGAKAALDETDFTYGGTDSKNNVTQNFSVPVVGNNGTSISWEEKTDTGNYISIGAGGTITVTKPSGAQGDKTVVLKAIISKENGTNETKELSVVIKAKSTTEEANEAITAAKKLIPATFAAIEGSTTNLLTYLNSITGMSGTGVTLTVDASSNANVKLNGDISYTGSQATGNVTVKINKTDGTEQKVTIAVTVPARRMITPGAPGAVTVVHGNGQATVTFAPPASNGGSTITGYIVTANPGGITVSGTSSPIVVKGLTNGTAYTFTVAAANTIGTGTSSSESASVTPTASSAREITALKSPAGASITGLCISANVDNTTSSLKVEAAASADASWKLYSDSACTKEIADSTMQLSEGVNPAYIKVIAQDGSTKVYTLKVVRAAANVLRTGRAITEFSIEHQAGTAVINQAARTIKIKIADGISLNKLVSGFTLSPGASASIGEIQQLSGDSEVDFTNPVVYTVKAEDGKTANWTITVSTAKPQKNKEKEVTGFSLLGQVTPAGIDSTNGTVDIEVNESTNVKNLVATFSLSSGAKAEVDGVAQINGTTVNDFTNPVDYNVTAEDGSTKTWTVNVSQAVKPTITLDNIYVGMAVTSSKPVFMGKASKKDLPVNIYIDNKLAATTTSNYYKTWSYTLTEPMEDGSHTICIETRDAGSSASTEEITFVVATASTAHIKLIPNPATLVGDGKSESTLEIVVETDKNVPVSGVKVYVSASAGTLSSSEAVTGADGTAKIVMTAPKLSGVIPREEYITAKVDSDELKIESSIAIQFLPASIKGVVVDNTKTDRPPVAGAKVVLKEDIDGDGIVDFNASTTTGADGRYKIYVPEGNHNYTPIITIPIQIGNETVSVQVPQRAEVGELNGVGETIAANPNISGKLMVGTDNGESIKEVGAVFSGDNVSASLLTTTGDIVRGTVQVNEDGSFNIDNVQPGDYAVQFNITAPTGEILASQTAFVSVSQEGEMAVTVTLIDPYGVVTDKATGNTVSGVNMKLYWATTDLNTSQGRTPDTLVVLPELSDFKPNNNKVPQLTNGAGEYAWMVFPDGDYYIVAEKDGYYTYDSRNEKRSQDAKPGEDSWIKDGIIHVGKSIVKYDLQITQKQTTGGGNSDAGTVNKANTNANASVDVLVNGKAESGGTATVAKEGGRTVITIVVDESKLEQRLEKEGNNATITILCDNSCDTAVGEFNGQMVKNLQNKQSIVELRKGDIIYTLPAQQIDINSVSAKLGGNVQLKDIKVRIEISAVSNEMAKVVENSASKGEVTIVAPVVDFTVKCTYGGKTVETGNFNAYVERTIALPGNADPKKITTGVVVDTDGTIRHVPTKISIVNGRYYAKINSLSNSTYSVVWHPVEYSDVANHWAKDAVNEMASRMVISGTDNDMFMPERDITRAEFAAIIVRALGLKPGTGNTVFKDVKSSEWYCRYIQTAYEYGIISGYDSSSFGPMDKITREQAMGMIARAMKITGLKADIKEGDAKFVLAEAKGVGEISKWAVEAVAACIKTGIVSGRNGNNIAPKESITRAETVVIVRRLLQKSNLI